MLAMSGSPHQRLHSQPPQHYRNSSSPNSTCSEDDMSDHSQPNDLTTSRKHSSHPGAFPNYPPFYSPPHHSLGHHGSQQQSPFIATNECRIIEYRTARIAAFLSATKPGTHSEYLLCLPQAFELFLKHLVGGLHTVHTKLKRLDIVPIVCNVEQVRILRGLGAIQPGVNHCKLLSTKDFDILFKDCTTASRPGRPPKRSPVAGMVSPGPTSMAVATAPQQQPNSVPYLGFPPAAKKPRYADDADFGNESLDMNLKHQGNNNVSTSNNNAATAAAMLATNGYSAAFPFLQHFGGSTPTPQQQQQLVAAAAALGLPGLPPNRFPNSSPPPPGLASVNSLRERDSSEGRANNNSSSGERGGNNDTAGDFNPAAYLWLVAQQQSAAAASALNLSSRNAVANTNGLTSLGVSGRGSSEGNNNNSSASPPPAPTGGQPASGAGVAANQGPEQHCLETLLRNIEGLLAIAAHNARQQQNQLQIQKAELRAELVAQIERERELREHIEKQLNEEEKIRMLYQRRFKKERRFRRKLEHELQLNHSSQSPSSIQPIQQKQPPSINREREPTSQQQQQSKGSPVPQSPEQPDQENSVDAVTD